MEKKYFSTEKSICFENIDVDYLCGGEQNIMNLQMPLLIYKKCNSSRVSNILIKKLCGVRGAGGFFFLFSFFLFGK